MIGLLERKTASDPFETTQLNRLLKTFVEQSRNILGENLAGIYLHGSAAMGCFNIRKSDVDLFVVVYEGISDDIKYRYMDMAVALNQYAPKKGIEFSIVKKEVCNPVVYPTPFELHFSNTHLEWYETNPSDYINQMNGTDRDLAAHITMIYHRGKCLCGKEISDVFAKVSREVYFDSIWYDVKDAKEEIIKNPAYVILNLCRVLAYQKEELILSKQEGGKWGLDNVPEIYHDLISQAMTEYLFNKPIVLNNDHACKFAAYMIHCIKNE